MPWTQGKYNLSSSEDVSERAVGRLMRHQVVYGVATVPVNWAGAATITGQLNVCGLQSL
jgi:hypothetical protein